MQQYYVPQFIESESKVIGFLTLKQFLIIISPFVLIGLLIFIFKSKIIIFIGGAILVGFSIMLAFYKYQGQSLTTILSYGFNYFLRPKKYIWFKIGEEKFFLKKIEKVDEHKKKIIPQKKIEGSGLKIKSWLIQTGKYK